MRSWMMAGLLLGLFCSVPVAEACTTEQRFVANQAAVNPVFVRAKPSAFVAIVKKINAYRAEKGLDPVEANTLLVGYFKWNGDYYVGLALFSEGCATMSFYVPMRAWVEFLIVVGLSHNDFETKDGA